METFVGTPRYRGTRYKAANEVRVGRTAGHGTLDVTHQHALPVKDVLLHPLHRPFRQLLAA